MKIVTCGLVLVALGVAVIVLELLNTPMRLLSAALEDSDVN